LHKKTLLSSRNKPEITGSLGDCVHNISDDFSPESKILGDVPVAQLDRALASGAKAKKTQASNNQGVTKPIRNVLSSCLAISVSEAIEKHPELTQFIKTWPELPENIRQAIKSLIRTDSK
jgi:hypothetical protein